MLWHVRSSGHLLLYGSAAIIMLSVAPRKSYSYTDLNQHPSPESASEEGRFDKDPVDGMDTNISGWQ